MKQVRRLLSVILTVVLVVGTLYIGGNVNAATTVSSITISTDDYVLAAEENPNDPGGNGIVAYDESLADHINFYVNRYLDSDNQEQFYNGMTPFVEGTTYVLMLKVDTPKPGVVFADSLQVTAVMKGYSIALKMNKYITEGSIYYSCYYTMPKQSDLPTATANYDVSTGKVAISWTKKKSNSNYYKLYLQVMSNGSWTDKSVSPISSQQTSTSYTYNAAYDAPGSYRIKIAEYTSSASQSPNATQYSNQYAIEEPLDYKPENVKVTADSSGKYWFTWTKPAAAKNAQYYVLEGSKDGKIWNQLEKYSASYTEANISVENYKTILNPEIGAVNYFRICYETPTGGRSAYSDVVSSKYDNYEKNKDQLIAECEKLKKTPAKITYSGGFDVKKPVAAGMKKTYDHPSYNLSIECIKYNKSLAFKYTLTTKMDGQYWIFKDQNGDYFYQQDEWKDANGKAYKFADKYTAVKKGQIFTLISQWPYNNSQIGHNQTEIALNIRNNDIYYDATYYCHFDFSKAPTAGSVSVSKADTKSMTIVPGVTSGGLSCKISYRKKGAKKWTTKTTGSSGTTIKGLKPGKIYQVKWACVCKCSYTDDNGKKVNYTLSSKESKPKTVKTGVNTKPAVKSISISGAKFSHTWVPSQWLGNKLVTPGHYRDTTTFVLNIKLKKKVKGVKGYVIQVGANDPIFVKGNKTNIKIKTGVSGNCVGSNVKIKVSTYTNADKVGIGKFSNAKNVKIR